MATSESAHYRATGPLVTPSQQEDQSNVDIDSSNSSKSNPLSFLRSLSLSKLQTLKMAFCTNMRMLMTDSFVLTWNVASLITILFPLLCFTISRLANEQEWNWEQNQQGDQNENNNNNYNDNPYANPDNYDEYGNYVGPTHWWQFWKKNNNYNNGEEQNGDEGERRTPWWYVWGEEREGGDPEDEGRGAVLFVYVWTLVAIAGLLYLGNSTGMATNKLEGLRWACIGFANYCLVIMVLLVGLEAVEVEGRALEEDGFYGQTAVLLMLTCFFGVIQSIIFISWTGKRIANNTAAATEKSDGYVNVGYVGPRV